MSSDEQQQPPHQDRRRPFSVSDLNRRTREVKIYNTTTITTTTHNFDSNQQQTTSTIYSDGTQQQTDNSQAQTFAESFTTVNGQQIPIYTSGENVQKRIITPGQPLRSKSAFSTNSDHYQYNSLPLTITTNSSINAYPPNNRKIQFIYGKDSQQQQQEAHHEESTQDLENCEPFPKFPNVKHTVSTEISDPYFIQCNCRCNCNCNRNVQATSSRHAFRKQGSEDSYDNCHKYADRSTDNLVGNFSKKNMRVKDVEVECEIEEDPAIFEGSEGYVKNLISKIQQQYKNPETVHIKITRRQKPENIDANGNLIHTANESYGQIVRKEYYTIRTTNRPKKTSSMSSFVDTANIPYIDGSDDDRSARNSRIDMEKNLYIPNYTIEKHVIYNEGDEKKPKKDRPAKVKLGKEIGIRDLVSSLGGVIKKENLDIDRSESMSPTRLNESLKIKADKNRSKSVAVSEEDVKLNSGLSGFFKCGRSGRVKSPEVKKEKEPKPAKEPKAPKAPKVKADKSKSIKLPDVDIDVNAPKIELPEVEPVEVKVDVPEVEVDVDSEEYKNGMRGFFKGLGGKIKAPEAEVKVKEVHVETPEPAAVNVDIEVNKPEVDLEALTAEIDASLPKFDASLKKEKKPPKERKPKKDSFEFKAPKISMPDFQFPKPKFPKYEGEVETPKIDLEVEAPEVKVEVPQVVEVEIKEPEVPVVDVEILETKPVDWEIDVNSPEYNNDMKDFFKGLGGKVSLPEADVNVEEVNVILPEIEEPKPVVDVEVKEPKVKIPKYDRKYELTIGVDPSVRSSDMDTGFTSPTEGEIDIDINSPEYKSGVKGFFKGIGGKIKAPEVYLPDMIIGAPEIDLKETKVKKVKEPKAPKVKEPKVKKPKVEVNVPEFEVPEVEVDVETKVSEPEIDINSPEYKNGLKGFFKGLGGKIKAPESKVTEVEVTAPEVAVEVPEIEVNKPKLIVDGDVTEFDATEGDVSVPSPDFTFDVDSPEYNDGVKNFFKDLGGKVQLPEGEVAVEAETKPPKQSKPKAPKIDLPDFTMPKFTIRKDDQDIEIKSPEIKIEVPQVKAPEVDVSVQSPDLDFDVNSPEYKNGLKGFFKGIGGKVRLPEAKNTEIEITTPEVNVEVPEVEAPKVEVAVEVPEVQAPEVDVSVQSPDLDFDVNSPEYKNGLKGFFKGLGGKVDVPAKTEVEVEAPRVEVDIEAPKVDVEVDTPKVKSPKSRTPSKVKCPRFCVPSRSKSRQKIEVDVISPEPIEAKTLDVEVDAHLPNIDVHEEPVDVNSPEYINGLKGFFKGLGGKVKLPEAPVVETPVVAAPEVPSVEVEVALPEVPEVEVKLEEPTVPEIDFDVNSPEYKNGLKGFFKGFGGKIKAPEVDVKLPECETNDAVVEIQAPEAEVVVPVVEINKPKFIVDVDSPIVDTSEVDLTVQSSDYDIDVNSEEYKNGIKGFFKGLGGKVNLPQPEFKLPEVQVEVPEVAVEVPKVKVEVQEIPAVPEVEVEVETKVPEPEIDINSPEYKNGMRGFFKGLGGQVKLPESKVTEIEVTAPEVEVAIPEVEVPEVEAPKVDLDIDINSPEYKNGLKGFFKGLGGKVDVQSTEAEVDIEAPKVDVDIEAPKVDVEVKSPKIKSPKIKSPKERRPRSEGPSFRMPSLCSRSKSKSKKTDLPTVDVEVPAATADIDMTKPDVEIDYESPEYKGGLKNFFKGLGGKIKAPETPAVEVSVTAPEIQADVEVKEPELPVIEVPKVDIEVETPTVDVEVETPKVDLDIDVNSPEYKNGMKGFFQGIGGKVQLPENEVDVKTPEIEVETEVKSSKKDRKPRKRPTIELPDFHLPRFRSSSKTKKDRDVSVDVEVKSPEVEAKVLDVEVDASLPKIEIDETKVDVPEVEVVLPEVEVKKQVDLDFDVNSEEYQHGLKDFLMNLGGRVKLSETHVQAEKPDVEVETVKVVEEEAPKVIDIEVKAPEVEENLEIDINSPEYKGGIKGFFKGIGGKIKAPEVNVPLKSTSFENPELDVTEPEIEVSGKVEVPDIKISVPEVTVYNVQTKIHDAVVEVSEVEESTTVITKVSDREEIKREEGQKTDIYIRGLNLDEHKQFVYGIDLPMTIVNNDWHWSPESVREGIDERKIFFRQYTDEDSDKTSSNYINSGSFPMGNLSLITNTELSTSSTRSRAVDYELKKTKITKEKVTQKPGKAAIKERDQSVPKSKSSTGSFFRKLSSASSISNLDLKKSFQAKANITRSESADPSSRTKIDYSIPRKCYILTKPDFNGLGIHIACDKKTRRFPYIYEIEPNSPGLKSGLRKNDFILEVNDQDAVDMEFKELINRIQEYIQTNNLCLTVGNEKAHKKWIKARTASLNRTKSKV